MDLKDVPFFKAKATPEIKKAYHVDNAEFQQTKLVLASSVVSVRAMMDLITNRATLSATPPARPELRYWPPPWLVPHSKNEPKDRWPELSLKPGANLAELLPGRWPEIAMAQSDCFACHHDLKSKSWRQLRGYQGKPGRPQLQPWPMVLLKLALPQSAAADLAAARKQLQSACDAQPFGIPSEVAGACATLEKALRQLRNPAADIDRNAVRELLKKLTTFGANEYPDYDSARQLAWAFRMIYADLVPADKQPAEVKRILDALDDDLSLTLNSQARKPHVAARYAEGKKLLAEDGVENALKNADKPGGVVDSLHRILNQELSAVLERVAQYDPIDFKKKMEQLGTMLP
jgi:hypothetical protein